MSDPSVEEAIARVKAGDIDAYALVVSAYQRRLRALLASACPPGVDSDELAHRTLVFAYQRIDHYQLNTEFFAWLSAIGRNLLRAEFERIERLSRNQHGYSQHVQIHEEQLRVTIEPVLDEAKVAALRACRAQLPPQAQGLLQWYYGEQTTLSGIAARLGKSAAAVKSLLFATRKRLRACMEKKLRPPLPRAVQKEGYESI